MEWARYYYVVGTGLLRYVLQEPGVGTGSEMMCVKEGREGANGSFACAFTCSSSLPLVVILKGALEVRLGICVYELLCCQPVREPHTQSSLVLLQAHC
jgi:hypothetical protein